jgi:5-methylcytosine-specific restriction endonuclease McrA
MWAAAAEVKLYTNHILPISKGGKDTLDNLRTFYDEYNLNKRT